MIIVNHVTVLLPLLISYALACVEVHRPTGSDVACADRYCDRWSSGSLAIITLDLKAFHLSHHLNQLECQNEFTKNKHLLNLFHCKGSNHFLIDLLQFSLTIFVKMILSARVKNILFR